MPPWVHRTPIQPVKSVHIPRILSAPTRHALIAGNERQNAFSALDRMVVS